MLSLITMNTLEDEIVIPEEHPDYPGYYKVPGNSLIVINRQGECISTHTGNVLQHYSKDGYRAISCLIPEKSKSGKWRYLKAKVHRMLALAFLGRPAKVRHIPFELLDVNHIDHDRWNCGLTNLEWCTHARNLQAASEFGDNNWAKKILSKDIRTEEIKVHTSIRACAKFFDINEGQLKRHLVSDEVGRRTLNWHVFKVHDNSPWPILHEYDRVESKWDHDGFVCLVKENDPTTVVLFPDLRETAEFLGIKQKALKDHRSKKGPLAPVKGWIVTRYTSVIGHFIGDLQPSKYSKRMQDTRSGSGLAVLITDTYVNSSVEYKTASEAARALGVDISTILDSVRENRAFSVHFRAKFIDA